MWTGDDVRRITAAQATDIFIEHYFERPRIGGLPEVLQPASSTCMSTPAPTRCASCSGCCGGWAMTSRWTGSSGRRRRAAHAAARAAPDHLADAYGIARRSYYYRLADRRPASRKYAPPRDGGKGGWIVRAEAFISPRYHLSAAQHRERVAAWD
jgi:hypothetical protein